MTILVSDGYDTVSQLIDDTILRTVWLRNYHADLKDLSRRKGDTAAWYEHLGHVNSLNVSLQALAQAVALLVELRDSKSGPPTTMPDQTEAPDDGLVM